MPSSLLPLLYEGREIEAGKCGRCGKENPTRYLWCDQCEDLVQRVGNTDWIERHEEEPEVADNAAD